MSTIRYSWCTRLVPAFFPFQCSTLETNTWGESTRDWQWIMIQRFTDAILTRTHKKSRFQFKNPIQNEFLVYTTKISIKSRWNPNNARIWSVSRPQINAQNERATAEPLHSHSHRFSCTQYAFIQVFIWYSLFVQQPRAHWSWNIQICLIYCVLHCIVWLVWIYNINPTQPVIINKSIAIHANHYKST